MPPKKFSITAILDYDPEIIESFTRMIETVIDDIASDKNARFFLKIAVNELVVNSVEHGYNKQGGPVSVYLLRRSGSILLEVSDLGTGLRPELLNLEKKVESLDDLTTRGWGLSILRKVSSSFTIKSNDPEGTVISMTMPLNSRIGAKPVLNT